MQQFRCQFNYDEQTCSVMAYTGDEAHVVVPETFGGKNVTILFDKLFAGHTELESVRIPDTVTDLGEFVFDGCERLRAIVLPTSLQFLWGYTFARCGVEELVLPDGVRDIPPYAFKDCKHLKKVVCGAGLRKIHAWAFGGCDRLAELVCGPDVDVSERAFERNAEILRIEL